LYAELQIPDLHSTACPGLVVNLLSQEDSVSPLVAAVQGPGPESQLAVNNLYVHYAMHSSSMQLQLGTALQPIRNHKSVCWHLQARQLESTAWLCSRLKQTEVPTAAMAELDLLLVSLFEMFLILSYI